MNAPFRPLQDRQPSPDVLDPALERIIEALAEAQAAKDYAARFPTPEALAS